MPIAVSYAFSWPYIVFPRLREDGTYGITVLVVLLESDDVVRKDQLFLRKVALGPFVYCLHAGWG